MNPHLERAHTLWMQHRTDLAVEELRQALAQDPDDGLAHGMLAICLSATDHKPEALEEARLAVRHAPDRAFSHYATACILESMGRLEPAHEAIAQAIRLDPADADYFEKQGFIFARQEKWDQALSAARQGLAVDAQHVDCLNLQGLALTHLGRGDEARRSVEDSLARDPQNPFSHASMGWALLHQSRHKEALEHFREALRLNPNLEYARSGMVEALKARHLLYRLMLMYFLWMSRLSSKARWGVVIAIYIGTQFAKFSLPILVPLLVFVYLTWTAMPFFNLLLRLNPYGRYVLARRQVIASNFVGAFLLGAVAALGAWLWSDNYLFLFAAVYLGTMVIPVAATFGCSAKKKRTIMAAYSLGLLIAGASSIALLAMNREEGVSLIRVYFIGLLLFSLLANVSFGSEESE